MCLLSHFSCVQLSATLWTAVYQASLSVGFSKQECWSALPFSPPGDLPHAGIQPASFRSDLHWKVGVRSEGESCQDSELIRKGISGAYWHCVLQKRKLKTEDGGEYRDHRRSANRGGAGGPDHLLVPRPLLLTINNTTPKNEICHRELTRAKHLASHLALVCAQ